MKTNISGLLLLLALPASAVTTFLGTNSNDFNDATNWDNGLPSNGGNDGTVAAPAVLTAKFNSATGISYHLNINSTLDTGAFELQHRSGSNGRDLRVGDGAGTTGTLTVNSGGRLDIAGAGSDLFIGHDGGTGTVIFENGSTFQVSKAIEILNGSLTFQPTVSSAANLTDELVVDDTGTLAYGFDGSFTHFTLAGGSLALELGATSTLDLTFAATPTLGASYTLITDVSSFGGVSGVFGSVNATGLDTGQSLAVDYGSTTPGELIVTVVPEPGTVALALLAGLGLLVRRRHL